MKHLALCWLVGSILITSVQARPLTVVTLPGSVYNEVGIPLLRDLYQQVDTEIQALAIPASRQAYMLQGQEVDAVIVYPEGLEQLHPEFIRLPTPLTSVRVALFTARTDLDWPLPPGLSLGVVRGISDSSVRATLPPGLDIMELNDPSQLMRMVSRDRLDLVLLPYTEGLAIIRDLKLETVRPVGPFLAEKPLYHYLHQRHQHLAAPLDAVLRTWTENGYLEATHRRFREELEADAR